MRYYSTIYTTQGRRRRVAGWGAGRGRAGRGRAGRGARGPRGDVEGGAYFRSWINRFLDAVHIPPFAFTRGGRGWVAEMRREPQDMLARPLRPCACALMHRVLLQYMFGYATSFNGDISGWNTSSVTTMFVRASAHLPTYVKYPGAHLVSPAYLIPSAFRVRIYRRGKHAGAEVSPVRREPRACARTPTPPVRLRSCTVCCCSSCLVRQPRSMATSPDGTRAPSRLCLYVPAHTCRHMYDTPAHTSYPQHLRFPPPFESAYITAEGSMRAI